MRPMPPSCYFPLWSSNRTLPWAERVMLLDSGQQRGNLIERKSLKGRKKINQVSCESGETNKIAIERVWQYPWQKTRSPVEKRDKV